MSGSNVSNNLLSHPLLLDICESSEEVLGHEDVTLRLSEDDLLIKKRHLCPYSDRTYDRSDIIEFYERKRLTSSFFYEIEWCVVLYLVQNHDGFLSLEHRRSGHYYSCPN